MSVSPNFPILLRTSRRDIRVNRGKANRFGQPPDAGALKFVSARLKRYIERDWLDPFHRFILRRNRIGAAIQHHHQHQQINIAPNLALTVLNWTSQSADTEHFDLISRMPHVRYQRETQLIKTVIQRREAQLIEQLLDQVVERKARVEIRSGPSAARPSIPQMAEIPRVIRRAIPSKIDQALVNQDVNQRMEGKPQERKISNENYRVPEPALDINRLTDQVIQKIDHRILAQRERLGRF